jgi:hypothetical protein
MTTVLIIVCIVACVGVVLAIVGHMGSGIVFDRIWSRRVTRHHHQRGRRTHTPAN